MVLQVPLWLRNPLKRFIQYWGVVFAALPSAFLYIALLGWGWPNVAFVLCFAVGLACAYFCWRWLDLILTFSQPQEIVFVNVISSANTTTFDPRFGLAGGSLMFLMIVTTPQPVVSGPVDQSIEAIGTHAVLRDTNALA